MTTGQRSRSEVLRAALGHEELRRLAAVLFGFEASEAGAWISITVVAHQFGGVREASLVLVAQLVPAAIAALAAPGAGRRWGARRVLVGGLGTQALLLTLITLLLAADAPHLLVYTPAVVASVAMVFTRPTLAAILPTIVDDPHELTAANAMVGWLDGGAAMVGPLLAAVCLALGGLSTPFVVFGGIALGATIAAWPVRPPAPAESPEVGDGPEGGALARGLRAAGVRPSLVLLGAFGLVLGALDLFFVVIAVDVTGGEPARAAWFSAVFGLGSIAGGGAAVLLIGRRLLWPAVAVTGAAGVAALAVIGLGGAPLAAVALAVCGAAVASLLVGTKTLLQRLTDLEALCRVFSVAESSDTVMLLAGAIVVPTLIAIMGDRWAATGVALIVAVVAVVALWSMRRAEGEVSGAVARIPLLRASDLFSLLGAPALETLARNATDRDAAAGSVIVRQGDEGDEFFVITAGEVRVERDGEVTTRLGPGDGFGELALLLDGRRLASVIAESPTHLLVIDRRTFLVAVTNHAESHAAARATAERLSRD